MVAFNASRFVCCATCVMASTIFEISCVFSPNAKTSWLAVSMREKTFFTFSPASTAAREPSSAAAEVAVAALVDSSAEAVVRCSAPAISVMAFEASS